MELKTNGLMVTIKPVLTASTNSKFTFHSWAYQYFQSSKYMSTISFFQNKTLNKAISDFIKMCLNTQK